MNKHCNKCNTDKPVEDFHNEATRSDGKARYCKLCTNSYRRAWYKSSNSWHERKWGLNPEQIQQLVEFQNNRCGICNSEFTKTPYVDHCHETSYIRGLLCRTCNAGLGMLGDNREAIVAALHYLDSTTPPGVD